MEYLDEVVHVRKTIWKVILLLRQLTFQSGRLHSVLGDRSLIVANNWNRHILMPVWNKRCSSRPVTEQASSQFFSRFLIILLVLRIKYISYINDHPELFYLSIALPPVHRGSFPQFHHPRRGEADSFASLQSALDKTLSKLYADDQYTHSTVCYVPYLFSYDDDGKPTNQRGKKDDEDRWAPYPLSQRYVHTNFHCVEATAPGSFNMGKSKISLFSCRQLTGVVGISRWCSRRSDVSPSLMLVACHAGVAL